MTSKNTPKCTDFIDDLADCASTSEKFADHISKCAMCADMRQIVCYLKKRSTLLPSHSNSLEARILEQIVKSQKSFVAENKFDFFSLLEVLRFKWLLVSGVLVLIILAIGLLSKKNVESNYNYILDTVQEFNIAFGGKKIDLSDGSNLELTGPANGIIKDRYLLLRKGTALISVTSGDIVFVVETPHVKIKVLGTKFRVEVENNWTMVNVIAGRVQVIQNNMSKILSSGESYKTGTLGKSQEKTINEGQFVPSVDEDVDKLAY